MTGHEGRSRIGYARLGGGDVVHPHDATRRRSGNVRDIHGIPTHRRRLRGPVPGEDRGKGQRGRGGRNDGRELLHIAGDGFVPGLRSPRLLCRLEMTRGIYDRLRHPEGNMILQEPLAAAGVENQGGGAEVTRTSHRDASVKGLSRIVHISGGEIAVFVMKRVNVKGLLLVVFCLEVDIGEKRRKTGIEGADRNVIGGEPDRGPAVQGIFEIDPPGISAGNDPEDDGCIGGSKSGFDFPIYLGRRRPDDAVRQVVEDLGLYRQAPVRQPGGGEFRMRPSRHGTHPDLGLVHLGRIRHVSKVLELHLQGIFVYCPQRRTRADGIHDDAPLGRRGENRLPFPRIQTDGNDVFTIGDRHQDIGKPRLRLRLDHEGLGDRNDIIGYRAAGEVIIIDDPGPR